MYFKMAHHYEASTPVQFMFVKGNTDFDNEQLQTIHTGALNKIGQLKSRLWGYFSRANSMWIWCWICHFKKTNGWDFVMQWHSWCFVMKLMLCLMLYVKHSVLVSAERHLLENCTVEPLSPFHHTILDEQDQRKVTVVMPLCTGGWALGDCDVVCMESTFYLCGKAWLKLIVEINCSFRCCLCSIYLLCSIYKYLYAHWWRASEQIFIVQWQ